MAPWEFGTGKIVVSIYAALGREGCRQKCPGCHVHIAERWIELRN